VRVVHSWRSELWNVRNGSIPPRDPDIAGTFLTGPRTTGSQHAKEPSLVVNVVDLHGRNIRDLTKNNFRVQINSSPALISDAQYSVAPRRIVVVLDMSSSMAEETDNGKWRGARAAVDDLLTQVPSDVPIAMVTFSDQVRQTFDFSQGRAAVAQWFKQGPSERANIKRKSKTALFDAILAGLRLLDPSQMGDVVYAITDGEENHSHSSQASTETTLLKSGVRLFAFVFDDPTPVNEVQEAKESFLRMVGDSGGLAFGIFGRQVPGGPSWNVQYDYDQHSQEKLKVFTQVLSNAIKGFWILELAVPSQSKKSKVKLEIIDQRGKARKDLTFSYPRVLLPTN
jgi:von Willebrand factor type A domain